MRIPAMTPASICIKSQKPDNSNSIPMCPVHIAYSEKFRKALIAVTVLIPTVLEISIHYFLGIRTGYTHFYYLFLVAAAVVLYRRTVILGIYLAGLHLGIDYLITGGPPDTSTLFRALMFVVVALIFGFLYDRLEQAHGDMIAYVIERTLSGRSPVSHDTGEGPISIRTVAGTTIPLLKENRNVRGLISALRHPDVETRYRAVIALGELGDPDAVGPLAGALNDENSGVRWEAAEALGKIGEPAAEALIGALQDEDDDIRWRAAIALGDVKSRRAIGPLVGALKDPDPFVRSRVVNSLSHFGGEAIEPIITAFRYGGEEVRAAAAASLSKMSGDAREEVREAIEACEGELCEELNQAIREFREKEQRERRRINGD